MNKLLLFLALAAIALVSGCVGKTETGATVNENEDVSVSTNMYDEEVTSSNLDDELMIEEVTDEETTMNTRTRTQTTRDDEDDEGPEYPEYIQLKSVTMDTDEVAWGDTLTVTYTIWNNKTKAHKYNVVIQIFDEDENLVYAVQEENLNIIANKTKTFETEIDISNTFDRGTQYFVHAGLFDEDWNMLEWNWHVGNFTVR